MVAIETRIDDARLLVLASLASGPKHGYAIMKDVEAFADGHEPDDDQTLVLAAIR